MKGIWLVAAGFAVGFGAKVVFDFVGTGEAGAVAPSVELEGNEAASVAGEDLARTDEALGSPSDALGANDRRGTVESSETSVREETKPSPGDALFSVALLQHFRREYHKGWLTERSSPPTDGELGLAEEEFREHVLAMPAQLGERHAREKTEEEAVESALASADGVQILAALDDGDCELPTEELVGDLLDRIVTRRSGGATVDGATLPVGDGLEQGMLITFGPGIHVLDERTLRGTDRQTLPSDIEIRGAGMGSTLLRIGNIGIRGDVERLAFRDMTIDCENDGLFDMRTGALVLDLERVRIVRFDAAHGGAYVFSSRGSAIRARNCEILGGYGRSPGHGNVFRGSPVVARFDDCRFELCDATLSGSSLEGGVVYRGCTFSRMKGDPTSGAGPAVLFEGCVVESVLDAQELSKLPTKSLSELGFW